MAQLFSLGIERMFIIAQILKICFGVIFVVLSLTVGRRFGVGFCISGILWGLFTLTCGVFGFAEAINHPLLSPDAGSMFFAVMMFLCLLSFFLLRDPKNKKT